jgi:ketosteroid isomerase-like protein
MKTHDCKISLRISGWNCRSYLLALLLVFLAPALLHSEPTPSPETGIAVVVEAFTRALQQGDEKAAAELLAPDALILESGSMQTREEYTRKHLLEDIAMLRSVPMTRSGLTIKQEGTAGWATSLYHLAGKFEDKEINSQGAELMVLTKTPQGWRIRAIHWSNHPIKNKG